jgi:hypothetical protein
MVPANLTKSKTIKANTSYKKYSLVVVGRPAFDSEGVRNFSLLHNVQTGSVAHPAYPMGTVDSFPAGKAGGMWSWLLPSV